jgi:hypothetical protein
MLYQIQYMPSVCKLDDLGVRDIPHREAGVRGQLDSQILSQAFPPFVVHIMFVPSTSHELNHYTFTEKWKSYPMAALTENCEFLPSHKSGKVGQVKLISLQ